MGSGAAPAGSLLLLPSYGECGEAAGVVAVIEGDGDLADVMEERAARDLTGHIGGEIERFPDHQRVEGDIGGVQLLRARHLLKRELQGVIDK